MGQQCARIGTEFGKPQASRSIIGEVFGERIRTPGSSSLRHPGDNLDSLGTAELLRRAAGCRRRDDVAGVVVMTIQAIDAHSD